MDELLPVEQRPERIVWTKGVALPQSICETRHTVHCDGAKLLSIIELKAPVGDVAEAVRLVQNRVEHRGEIARRGVDDTQYLGGRRLLLQGLARLGDQPRILHRDDRLRGEILQQRDLLVGERPYLAPIEGHVAEKRLFLAQRDAEMAARAAEFEKRSLRRCAGAVRLALDDVGD